jgi:hypothetical protein
VGWWIVLGLAAIVVIALLGWAFASVLKVSDGER